MGYWNKTVNGWFVCSYELLKEENTEHISTLVTKHIGKTGAFIGC